nr:hypothetical protein [Tanacetum cinerariifolium]
MKQRHELELKDHVVGLLDLHDEWNEADVQESKGFIRFSETFEKEETDTIKTGQIEAKTDKTGQKREAWRSPEKSRVVSVDRARKTEENTKRMVKNANKIFRPFSKDTSFSLVWLLDLFDIRLTFLRFAIRNNDSCDIDNPFDSIFVCMNMERMDAS